MMTTATALVPTAGLGDAGRVSDEPQHARQGRGLHGVRHAPSSRCERMAPGRASHGLSRSPARRPADHPAPGPRRPTAPCTCGPSSDHRLPIEVQALRDLRLRPARLSMDEQLQQIHHVETPPAHHRSRPGLLTAGGEREPRAGPTGQRHAVVPMGNNVTNQGGELRDGNPPRPGEFHDR